MSSTKPYLLRALHQWCTDNGHTPYLVVHVDGNTNVPMAFVKDGEIVLNASYGATKGFQIENDWISFSARFGGVSHDLWIPVANVLSIFSRESGEGMGFELEPFSAPDQTVKGSPAAEPLASEPEDKPPARSHLRIVK